MPQSYPRGYPLNLFLDPAFSWPIYPIGCVVAVLVVAGCCYCSREGLTDTGTRLVTLLGIVIWPLAAVTIAIGAGLYSLRYAWKAVEMLAYVATLPFEIAGSVGAKRLAQTPGPAPTEADALPIPHPAATPHESYPVPCE